MPSCSDVSDNARTTEQQCDFEENKIESFAQPDNFEKSDSFFKILKSWLLPCSLRSHRTANPTPKNGLRHFSAMPTHHPDGWRTIEKNY